MTEKKEITITLQKIKEKKPCHDGWRKVLAAHKHPGMNTEFPLSSVLNSNDLDDTLWCLRCLPEHNNLWRKYAIWCARQVEHLMADERSRNALNMAWMHSNGEATDEELTAAGAAVESAAWAAMWAARAAVESAAGEASHADRQTKYEEVRAEQKRKLVQILNAGVWVHD